MRHAMKRKQVGCGTIVRGNLVQSQDRPFDLMAWDRRLCQGRQRAKQGGGIQAGGPVDAGQSQRWPN